MRPGALSTRRAALVAALVAGLVPRAVLACATCNCGDQTLTATGVEKPYQNRVRLTLDERYGHLTTGPAGASERVLFLRSALAVSWSPWSRFTLLAYLPWLDIWTRTNALPQQSINGLGDLELAARVVMFAERTFAPHHLLWGTVGLKLPTGYRVYDDQGYPYPDDDQPGSGSWDPLTGVTYGWFSGGLLSAFVSSSFRYTTFGPRGYRRGSTVGASGAVQLQPRGWVALSLGADFVWQQADELSTGRSIPNSGGSILFVAPAVLFSPRTDLLLRLVVDAPALAAMNGEQSVGTQVALSMAWDVR